jgi:hypothetical protein
MMTKDERKRFQKRLLAVRRAAGKLIDPRTCIIHMSWTVPCCDVYWDGIGCGEWDRKVWFARAHGSPIWVAFKDLPEATHAAISALMEAGYYEGLHSIGLMDDGYFDGPVEEWRYDYLDQPHRDIAKGMEELGLFDD